LPELSVFFSNSNDRRQTFSYSAYINLITQNKGYRGPPVS
jgi:hypothetical protein